MYLGQAGISGNQSGSLGFQYVCFAIVQREIIEIWRREREKERDGEREEGRQTDIQTDMAEREGGRQTDRETDRHGGDRQTGRRDT